jgi:Ca2+-binding RTX toxin-like protein
VLVSVFMITTGSPAIALAAPDAAQSAVEVRVGLIELGRAFGGIAALEPLATPIPLTDVAARDVLALDRQLAQRISAQLEGRSVDLDTIDDIISEDPALTMVDVTPTGKAALYREWQLQLELPGVAAAPLSYSDGQITFGTAELDGELAGSLAGTLQLRFDPDMEPLQRFAVVGDSDLVIRLWSRPTASSATEPATRPIPSFVAIDGFVEVDVAGTMLVDAALNVRLRDPNGRGVIIAEDLELGSAEDLFLVLSQYDPDAVTVNLTENSSLLENVPQPHGIISVTQRADNAAGPFATPQVTRTSELTTLTSATIEQALNGFSRFSIAMVSAESSIDASFPLMNARLTDLHNPGARLADLIAEQNLARIVCGAADTLPPSGTPRPGQVRYCQAITTDLVPDDGSVRWSTLQGTDSITDGIETASVGPRPTANVAVNDASPFPHLIVDFAVDGNPRRARSVVSSVQILGRALDAVDLTGNVGYDAELAALTVDVVEEVPNRAIEVATGGAPSLAPLSGLNGLCAARVDNGIRTCPRTGDAPAGEVRPGADESKVDLLATGRRFEATFGLGLVLPENGELPPFAQPDVYVQTAADRTLWSISRIEADLEEIAPMAARIGFLQVDVDLTSIELVSTNSAAAVAVQSGTVELGGDPLRSVANAVLVGDMMSTSNPNDADPTVAEAGDILPPTTPPIPLRDITLTATLTVADAPTQDGNHLLGVEAELAATWNDLGPAVVPGVTADPVYQDLRLLDLLPDVRGVASMTADVLVDEDADFERDFGVPTGAPAGSEARLVDRTIQDLSTGATCGQFRVDGKTTLSCLDGPLAGDGFSTGDAYLVKGDPTFLRDALLNDLATINVIFSTPEPNLGADRTFPLLDLKPADIAKAQTNVDQLLIDLMSAANDPGDPLNLQVSTLQGFTTAIAQLRPTATAEMMLVGDRLELSLNASSASAPLPARLRVVADDTLLRVTEVNTEGETVDIDLSVSSQSSIAYRFGIDLASGTGLVHKTTSANETVTGISGSAALAERTAELGSTAATTGAPDDIKLGIGVAAETAPEAGTAEWTALEDFRSTLESQRNRFGDAPDCGIEQPDPNAAACAVIALVDENGDDLDPVVVELGPEDSSGGTGGVAADRPLAYRFLADGLSFYVDDVETALNGNAVAEEVPLSAPLIGTQLDAGLGLPESLADYAITARTKLGEISLGEDDPAVGLVDAIDAAMTTAATANGLTLTDVTPAPLCNGATCSDDDTIEKITTITMALELSNTVAAAEVPFQSGLAGAPLHSDHAVVTSGTWTVNVTVGIHRGTGPFLRFETEPAIDLTVDAALPTSGTCHDPTRIDDWTTQNEVDRTEPATRRCIDGIVGYLPSSLIDLGGTNLDAASVTVVPSATVSNRDVYLPELIGPTLPAATKLEEGVGGLDLYFESWASDLGFFDVVGSIRLDWDNGAFGDLAYENMYLDATSVTVALGPGLAEAKSWLEPLSPALEALQAPVPVATQLSQMVGKGPVTLLSLLVAEGGTADLVGNAVAFRQAVDTLQPDDADAELVALGEDTQPGTFFLTPDSVRLARCPTKINASSIDAVDKRCNEQSKDRKKDTDDAPKPDKDKKKAGKDVKNKVERTKSAYVSIPSVSFPVLSDASEVYDIVLARGDTALMHIDLGEVGGQIAWEREFGPFMLGPVPVTPAIGLTFGIEGHFAMGFDTYGLSERVRALETPGDVDSLAEVGELPRGQVFREGFFIDDQIEEGDDQPEIVFSAAVSAGASISIAIASAGISGSAILDLWLDAFDPNSDGRIRWDEFAGVGRNECAFDVSSGIRFLLEFVLTLNLLFFTAESSWTIVESPRVTIFEFLCDEPPEVVLATKDSGTQRLYLNMGALKTLRKGFDTDTESFTIRQIDADTVEVAAFNLVQTYAGIEGWEVVADGGVGDDKILFHPGQVAEVAADGAVSVRTVPFDMPIIASGGAGNDQLVGGIGNDHLYGDRVLLNDGSLELRTDATDADLPGNDTIESNEGDDVVVAGPGDDIVTGGSGHDTLDGGPDDDSIDGGAGPDLVSGGSGNDRLAGGPGVDPAALFPSDDPVYIAAILDSGDLVVGGADTDDVSGGRGSDLVIGGDLDADIDVDFDAPSSVVVTAVRAGGQLVTVTVPHPTVSLPAESEILLACDSPGDESGGDDLVSGGPDRDYLLGGSGPDRLDGGAGSDIICGRAGNDLLFGESDGDAGDDSGADMIIGGPGSDRLYGAAGADELYGDDGDDLLRGGAAGDLLVGGPGADLMLGEGGADEMYGDDPDLPSVAGSGDAREIRCAVETRIVDRLVDLNGDLVGDENDDGQLEGLTVVGGVVQAPDGGPFSGTVGSIVFVEGRLDLNGDGNKPETTAAPDNGVISLASMTGAVDNGDCLFGGDDPDPIMEGQSGGDFVHGGDGDEPNILGGPGDDFLRGGEGADTVRGNAGNDLVVGDAGADTVEGNAGNDRLRGGEDDDRLIGGSPTVAVDGEDTLLGGRGTDVLAGGNAIIRDRTYLDEPSPIAGTYLRLLPTIAGGPTQPDDPWFDELYGGFGDDYLFGQEGNDLVRGGHDDDYVEGNTGDDVVHGDDHNDVVLGGGSAVDGVFSNNRSSEGLVAGDDTLYGDRGPDGFDGHDLLIGDNAVVFRGEQAVAGDGTMIPTFEVVLPDSEASGTDVLVAGGGWDVLIGGMSAGPREVPVDEACLAATLAGSDALEGDLLCGESGSDVLIGDRGTVRWEKAADVGTPRHLAINGVKNTVVPVFQPGELIPVVELIEPGVGGDDVLMGGSATDWLHGGAGADLASGGTGDDRVFGGDGADALWGDHGNDRLYGGHGTGDNLDVKPRLGADPTIWFVVAPLVDRDGLTAPTNGVDLIYGGWGHDALQADHVSKRAPGDRLIDWAGRYNVYYVCDGSRGRDTVIRSPSRGMEEFLRLIAANDGAADPGAPGSSGANELAYVYPQDIKYNTGAKHPDVKAPFSCDS